MKKFFVRIAGVAQVITTTQDKLDASLAKGDLELIGEVTDVPAVQASPSNLPATTTQPSAPAASPAPIVSKKEAKKAKHAAKLAAKLAVSNPGNLPVGTVLLPMIGGGVTTGRKLVKAEAARLGLVNKTQAAVIGGVVAVGVVVLDKVINGAPAS